MPNTIWQDLAAPLSKDECSWRIDGKPKAKDGRFFARVVAYCDVPAVVRRLDRVAPGRWEFKASEPFGSADKDGVVIKAVRGTLTVDGVTREDYGEGPDEKQALTDAFKRAARLFGIALELWDMDPVWTDVSDDTKYAKITGDPWAKYKKQEGGTGGAAIAAGSERSTTDTSQRQSPARQPNAQGTTQASALPGADYVMPIGKNRGKKLKEIDSATLSDIAAWVHDKQFQKKHADLLIAIASVLKAREAA
jgi:hypothetical protein